VQRTTWCIPSPSSSTASFDASAWAVATTRSYRPLDAHRRCCPSRNGAPCLKDFNSLGTPAAVVQARTIFRNRLTALAPLCPAISQSLSGHPLGPAEELRCSHDYVRRRPSAVQFEPTQGYKFRQEWHEWQQCTYAPAGGHSFVTEGVKSVADSDLDISG